MSAPRALAGELEFFEAHRQEFLQQHRGKYALIKDDECIGFFDDDITAFEEGVKRFGQAPFLIRQVLDTNRVELTPALVCGLIAT